MAQIEALVRRLGAEAGVDLPAVQTSGAEPALPSAFRIGTAAAASVGALTAAVAAYQGPGLDAQVSVDMRHAAAAFRSERAFRIDGRPLNLWAPLSGDYRTADGWVRLHCNFDHHRDAALRALSLPADAGRDEVVEACARWVALELEEAVIREAGCAAAMRSRSEWRDHPQWAAIDDTPLVRVTDLSGASRRSSGRVGLLGTAIEDTPLVRVTDLAGDGRRGRGPAGLLGGVRVLDLTRVIAGPVAGRILAAYGADVLRVGAAHVPEVPGAVIETAFGKRSCHIDLRSDADRLADLVREADVVIQAYRPGSLASRGFGPRALGRLNPSVVAVDISAYGSRGPWADRRGFDSLVQMVSGIAHEGGDGAIPQPLPCQALDHATGYLGAFGAVAGLIRGGGAHVEVSLARTAKWLDELGRVPASSSGPSGGAPEADDEDLLATMDSAFGVLTYVRPPGRIGEVEPSWSSPPPREGEHPAAWW
ncbi:CoA transferase [Streptosporangiaceae bacterium NEAU-GS5]|nr:CoA transferase [Streptosporangiaceae bacterium NEAU-GS5]